MIIKFSSLMVMDMANNEGTLSLGTHRFIVSNLFIYSLLLFSSAGVTVDRLRDGHGDSLVSVGGRFELGFFTPQGSLDGRRYVGIWFHGSNPQVVVWVANRNQSLSDKNGTFAIKAGNLVVLESNGTSLWSTNVKETQSKTTMMLMDSGNLVLEEGGRTLWESFRYPTDTFLPGMNMNEDLKLTSWISADDPSPGNFTFLKDVQSRYIIERQDTQYWANKGVWQNSSIEDEGEIVDVIGLLSSSISLQNLRATNYTVRFQNQALDYNYTRAVMSSSGKIQLLSRDRMSGTWNPIWLEPRNTCSVLTACGSFASCRSETKHTCRCLPGFEPKSKDSWNSGDYSGGCQRRLEICLKEEVKTQDFLTINMKVRKTSNMVKVSDDGECRKKCLRSCACQAYSEITSNNIRTAGVTCAIWDDELQNIWEYTDGGIDVNVRWKQSDIALTGHDCEACGSNIVPYPLSTGSGCGDPMYHNFTCDISTGQLRFLSDYDVTYIVPENRTFTIGTSESICRRNDTDAIQNLLQLKQSPRFKVSRGCDFDFNKSNSNPSLEEVFLNEVDIQWEKPFEPNCTSSKDCRIWPNSACNSSTDGTKRCLCSSSFEWTGIGCHIPTEVSSNREPPKQRNVKVGIIVPVAVVTTAVLIVISCLVLYVYYKRRNVQNQQEKRTSDWRNQEIHLYDSEKRVRDFMGSRNFGEDDRKAIEVPNFDLETLLAATDNFSEENKIGRGGFGTVYKGKFPGGLEIAIKRLAKGSSQGIDEFKNEAILIAKLQHRNLVRLLGYCVVGEEKMLVYEYMPNKSLDIFIFDRSLCLLVSWEMRFNIILGIVRGLVYLHEDSRLRVIHRDLKTSNVLLDAEMNPKISDFGLARIFDVKQTEATTERVVGTYGYMSPEYALDGSFSVKSDVFSFGIVLLEIVSGRRNTGFYKSKVALPLLGYVWKLWTDQKPLDVTEAAVRESCNPSEVIKCINVGLLCVQEDPDDRPTMSNIAFMLGSGSDPASLPNPKQPAFVDKIPAPAATTTSSSSGTRQEIMDDCSLLEPR